TRLVREARDLARRTSGLASQRRALVDGLAAWDERRIDEVVAAILAGHVAEDDNPNLPGTAQPGRQETASPASAAHTTTDCSPSSCGAADSDHLDTLDEGPSDG